MTITFGAVCSLLQTIENISSQTPRAPQEQEKEAIRQIICNWFANQRNSLDDAATNGGAVLSVLFPHRRKDRVYNLGPPRLARKLINILGLNRGQRALFDGWDSGALGDLGVYTERALRSRDGTFRNKHNIAIESIDRLLIQLAARSRFSDKSIRAQRDKELKTDKELERILVRLESWEAKWLVRLILRDYCTVALDENYLLRQYHFLLPDLLRFQNDFDTVFGLLRGDLSSYPANPSPVEERRMRIEAAQKLHAVAGVKVGRPTFYKAWSFKHCFQLVGKRAWAAEVKYDGEYCEVHIDLDNATDDIKIFSKNGKDATADRKALHGPIRDALRIGRSSCGFKNQCIVLGEMVVYSDREKRILPFSKIRKHISRSGSFLGVLQDSLPHEWEHLMIVFFDVLKVDDRDVMRQCIQDRRTILRDLVKVIPGRSMRSEWTLLDCKAEDGLVDLKQAFARSLADRQEGLVLKPLHTPYFPLLSHESHAGASFFIKLKRDYLGDMGGERDLGDFAIIGASFDAQTASKTSLKPLHWTHFHLGCCTNLVDVKRSEAKPRFKIVATLSLDQCIPKSDVKFLNIHGHVRQSLLRGDGSTREFDIEPSNGLDQCMTVAFKQPFVAEILGGGFEKRPNETFEMLRHPRVRKLHQDRTWEDAVTLEDLHHMAEQKWEMPDANELDGHARDVALMVKKYVQEARGSQATTATDTDQTTQHTTPRSTQDTSERLHAAASPGVKSPKPNTNASPISTPHPEKLPPTARKRTLATAISPPKPKRRRVLSPLRITGSNNVLGSFDFDAQDSTLHIYAKQVKKVRIHASDDEEDE